MLSKETSRNEVVRGRRITGEQIRLPGLGGAGVGGPGFGQGVISLTRSSLNTEEKKTIYRERAGGSIKSALRLYPAEKRVGCVSSEEAPGPSVFFLICSNHKPIPLGGLQSLCMNARRETETECAQSSDQIISSGKANWSQAFCAALAMQMEVRFLDGK